MNGYFVFVDKDNREHTVGHVEYHFFEDHGYGAIEKLAELTLEDLEQLHPIFDYLKTQFPNGWKIENGKVVSA